MPRKSKQWRQPPSKSSVTAKDKPVAFQPTMPDTVPKGPGTKNAKVQGDMGPMTAKNELRGLVNLGNTCYMNSVIQCLSNLGKVRNWFLEEQAHREDLNRPSETRGEVAVAFSAVLRALWEECQDQPLAPSEMQRVVHCRDTMYHDTRLQHDAHEFYHKLMDWLHQDIQSDNGVSLVTETFHGQWQTNINCTACGYVSESEETFMGFQVELPDGDDRCSLRDRLSQLFAAEPLPGFICAACGDNNSSQKK